MKSSEYVREQTDRWTTPPGAREEIRRGARINTHTLTASIPAAAGEMHHHWQTVYPGYGGGGGGGGTGASFPYPRGFNTGGGGGGGGEEASFLRHLVQENKEMKRQVKRLKSLLEERHVEHTSATGERIGETAGAAKMNANAHAHANAIRNDNTSNVQNAFNPFGAAAADDKNTSSLTARARHQPAPPLPRDDLPVYFFQRGDDDDASAHRQHHQQHIPTLAEYVPLSPLSRNTTLPTTSGPLSGSFFMLDDLDPSFRPRDQTDDPSYGPRDQTDDPSYGPRDQTDDLSYGPRDQTDGWNVRARVCADGVDAADAGAGGVYSSPGLNTQLHAEMMDGIEMAEMLAEDPEIPSMQLTLSRGGADGRGDVGGDKDDEDRGDRQTILGHAPTRVNDDRQCRILIWIHSHAQFFSFDLSIN